MNWIRTQDQPPLTDTNTTYQSQLLVHLLDRRHCCRSKLRGCGFTMTSLPRAQICHVCVNRCVCVCVCVCVSHFVHCQTAERLGHLSKCLQQVELLTITRARVTYTHTHRHTHTRACTHAHGDTINCSL